jgi:hypothetical protein
MTILSTITKKKKTQPYIKRTNKIKFPWPPYLLIMNFYCFCFVAIVNVIKLDNLDLLIILCIIVPFLYKLLFCWQFYLFVLASCFVGTLIGWRNMLCSVFPLAFVFMISLTHGLLMLLELL